MAHCHCSLNSEASPSKCRPRGLRDGVVQTLLELADPASFDLDAGAAEVVESLPKAGCQTKCHPLYLGRPSQTNVKWVKTQQWFEV
jgi:hypothetical protein